MATFRVHLTTDHDSSPVTNLITGIGQVRDSEGTANALHLLSALEDEIAFVKRYILDAGHTAYAKGMTRSDSKRSTSLEDAIASFKFSAPGTADIRSNSSGSAIHP